MPDGDAGAERDDPGDAEAEPHLSRREVDRLGEVEHSGGLEDATADRVGERRDRERTLWSGTEAGGSARDQSWKTRLADGSIIAYFVAMMIPRGVHACSGRTLSIFSNPA